jgi:hypothetical protein
MADNVTQFRQFKIPPHLRVNSDFIPSKAEENTELALKDLQASGLTPEDIDAAIIGDLSLPGNALAGYLIPYTTPDGDWVVDENNYLQMWSKKIKYPEIHDPKAPKYINPTAAELAEHDLSSTPPYIPRLYHERPKTDILAICEGEKKTVAVAKHLELSAIGIGGCWNWRNKTTGAVDDWIMTLVKQHKSVVIIPDGDLLRYDICRAYGSFANELIYSLEGTGIEVTILMPEDKIDDLIVKWGPEAQANFTTIPRTHPNDLVEDPGLLAKRYNLAYRVVGKEQAVKVEQHHGNIIRLMEKHPAFEEIWMNTDKNTVMVGEVETTPGLTDMDICIHFQHNFQMPMVKPQQIRECLMQQALKNKRSPLLEKIKSTAWDHKNRLDTWLTRLWGVEDSEYTRQVARRWFVAAYARMEEPGCKVDWMLITTGAQGVGKSSMPTVMFDGNVAPLYGNSSDKDTMLLVHSGLCVVLDEMDSMNKKDVTFWKTLITTQEDKMRPPYGSGVMNYPRRSVIYGTTNNKQFLQEDKSGYRRYAPIEVNVMLDWDGFKQELPQLWAEAATLHLAGEPYVSIDAEMPNKKEYITDDPVKEKLIAFLEDWCAEPGASKWHGLVDGVPCWEFRLKDAYEFMGMEHNTSPKMAAEISNWLVSWGGVRVNNGIGRRGIRCWRFRADELRQHLDDA